MTYSKTRQILPNGLTPAFFFHPVSLSMFIWGNKKAGARHSGKIKEQTEVSLKVKDCQQANAEYISWNSPSPVMSSSEFRETSQSYAYGENVLPVPGLHEIGMAWWQHPRAGYWPLTLGFPGSVHPLHRLPCGHDHLDLLTVPVFLFIY